jgi:hypothetical protein
MTACFITNLGPFETVTFVGNLTFFISAFYNINAGVFDSPMRSISYNSVCSKERSTGVMLLGIDNGCSSLTF